jgi:hypothetical protein
MRFPQIRDAARRMNSQRLGLVSGIRRDSCTAALPSQAEAPHADPSQGYGRAGGLYRVNAGHASNRHGKSEGLLDRIGDEL